MHCAKYARLALESAVKAINEERYYVASSFLLLSYIQRLGTNAYSATCRHNCLLIVNLQITARHFSDLSQL